MSRKAKIAHSAGIISLVAALLIVIVMYGVIPYLNPYSTVVKAPVLAQGETPTRVPEATHIKTPEAVKSLYMTSLVAGSKKARARVVELLDDTEANAVVIDIKDYTGNIAFKVSDPFLQSVGSSKNTIPDIREFIEELHKKNIYVIGRVAVFQDLHMAKARPDLAVKNASGTAVWQDRKGITWIDAGSKEHWDYIIAVAKESYRAGFDEINFDYIRFPSDGVMTDVSYPFSQGRERKEVLHDFFRYIKTSLDGTGIVTSADLFGMTTTNNDDLGIGQVLEYALENFDYVAPMVYPSHYPENFLGYKNPASHPYEVVHYSMKHAVEKAHNASTTPLKLRPWLQDFNYKAVYTADMVRAQIKATYDVGLTSWMLWDPNNRFTREALNKE